jgi:hypothetical protein
MIKRKLTALGLITYFCFLMWSPLLGWHVHHACSENHHGFEEHVSESRSEHHGNECKSETLLSHAFEQGATLTASQIFHFSPICITIPALVFEFKAPVFEVATESKFAIEEDIGHPQPVYTASLQRAPPPFLA